MVELEETVDNIRLTDSLDICLSFAAEMSRGRPVSTEALLHAISAADRTGSWNRLLIPAQPVGLVDPHNGLDESVTWRAYRMTPICAEAMTVALRVAQRYRLIPVPPGVVGLTLVAAPSSGASRVMAALGWSRDEALTEIQDSILDVTLTGVDNFLLRTPNVWTVVDRPKPTGTPTHPLTEPDVYRLPPTARARLAAIPSHGDENYIGSWLGEYESELRLPRMTLLRLAVFRALLTLETNSAQSSWAFPDETVTSAVHANRSQHVIVRGSNLEITCGIPEPNVLTRDWTVRINPETGKIDVRHRREIDDAYVNGDLLDRLKSTVADALTAGPGLVTWQAGLPRSADVIRRQPCPFPDQRHGLSLDYVIKLQLTAGRSMRMPVPETEMDAVMDVFTRSGWPTMNGSDTALRTTSLHTGFSGTAAALSLRRDRDGPALTVDLPDHRNWPDQRTFRAALSILRSLCRDLSETAPIASATIDQWIGQWLAPWHNPRRLQDYLTLWSPTEAAEVTPFGLGAALPLGIGVDSQKDAFRNAVFKAQPWLLATERLWRHRGTATVMRRGPSFVRAADDMLTSRLRYVHGAARDIDGLVGTRDENWFWETDVHWSKRETGRMRGELLVTGLSRMDRYLCYGTELMRLLETYAWIVSGRDPEAEIQTLVMWL